MEVSFIADWINSAFAGYDFAILNFLHSIAISTNGALTPLMKLISYAAEDGIFFILLSLVLMAFKKLEKQEFVYSEQLLSVQF